MKKKLFLLMVLASTFVKAQTSSVTFAAYYTFDSVTQSTGVIDPTPTPTVTGLTCGSFSAAGTTTANANSTATKQFSFTRWPLGAPTGTTGVDSYSTMTGSLNPTKYYEVTLTPTSNHTTEITSILFTVRRSGTGIRNYAVRSSIDNFASNLPASVTTNTNLSVVANDIFFFNYEASTSFQRGSTVKLTGNSQTTPITFRFYAWNSKNNLGTFSLDEVTFVGKMTETCRSPSVTSISNNLPICSNDTLRLLPTVLGSPTFTYSWKGNGNFNSRSAKNATIRNPKTGIYKLIASNACGVDTGIVSVTINPTPTISVNSESICIGNSVTLNSSGATSYTWSTGELTSNIVVSPSLTTTYTIIATNTLNCESFKTVTVTVNSLPTLSVTASTDKICWGNSATLMAEGASTYSWSTNEAGPSVTVAPTSSTTYTIIGTNSDNCENQATITVTVNSLPSLSVTTNTNKICLGNSATLIAEGADTYTWSTNDANSSVTVTPTSSATYTVIGTNSDNCENQATITLTVVTMPTLSVTASTDKICWGNSATLTAEGASTYSWSTNEVSSSVTVSPTTTTTFTVVGTNSDICESQAVITVTVNSLPNVALDLSSIQIQCSNTQSVILSGGTPLGGTYSGNHTNLDTFYPSVAGIGTFTVTYSYTDNNQCSNSIASEIEVSACTGIQSSNDASIQLYPNPNKGYLYIKLPVAFASIEIYDVFGKKVLSQNIETTEIPLNVSYLENSVYTLHIKTSNQLLTNKIIIDK